jgi:hypothetical protein
MNPEMPRVDFTEALEKLLQSAERLGIRVTITRERRKPDQQCMRSLDDRGAGSRHRNREDPEAYSGKASL